MSEDANRPENQGKPADSQGNSTDDEKWRRRESNPRPARRKGIVLQTVAASTENALAHTLARESPTDPELARIIAAWPTLPAPIRAGVLALVNAAMGDG